MKTSFKISALVLVFAALSFGAKAQTSTTSTTTTSGVRYSIGVDAGIPVGDFNKGYGWNLGGSIQADIPVVSQLFVTVNAGYDNVFGKTTNGFKPADINLIPVKAGLKFFPVQNFYVQGEAGVSFLTNRNSVGVVNGKSALFTYAPQVGVLFPVSNKNFIDAGVRFESNSPIVSGGSNLNFVGVRLAYAFGM